MNINDLLNHDTWEVSWVPYYQPIPPNIYHSLFVPLLTNRHRCFQCRLPQDNQGHSYVKLNIQSSILQSSLPYATKIELCDKINPDLTKEPKKIYRDFLEQLGIKKLKFADFSPEELLFIQRIVPGTILLPKTKPDWKHIELKIIRCSLYSFIKLNEKNVLDPNENATHWQTNELTHILNALYRWKYIPVQNPQKNALAVYGKLTDKAFEALHFGICTDNEKIISKWGQFPVMEHDVENQPYGQANAILYLIKP